MIFRNASPHRNGESAVEILLAKNRPRLRNDPMQLNLKYDDRGLIPAIVQESAEKGGRVLMMAWMNEDSLRHSVETGYMHYWSRSRKKLWKKGESSGHTQRILRWFVDCDRDTLLFEVEQYGGACHTGFASCFYVELDKTGNDLPPQEEPLFSPDSVYKG
jgi:phosphoribosyl-AMP cyclohydrolase